jgi:CDP-diacylglycerol---serine O-phosphatidyltransferase
MQRRRGRGLFRRRRLDLKRTLFVLPNMITLSSVFCGFYSMVLSSKATADADFHRAALLLVFAMVFDMLDGRVARMTKTQSAFGLQIDSLADVLSFGAAPALLMYHLSLSRLDWFGLDWLGLAACFAYTACGAIRLARFNVLASDPTGAPTKPSKYIVGLPIPGAAGIVVAIVVATHAAGALSLVREHGNVMAGILCGLAGLMVSSFPFRSFKEIRLNARTILFVAVMIGSSAVVAAKLQPAFVLLWLLGCYVLMGIVEWMWQIPGRLAAMAAAADRPSTPPMPSEPPPPHE